MLIAIYRSRIFNFNRKEAKIIWIFTTALTAQSKMNTINEIYYNLAVCEWWKYEENNHSISKCSTEIDRDMHIVHTDVPTFNSVCDSILFLQPWLKLENQQTRAKNWNALQVEITRSTESFEYAFMIRKVIILCCRSGFGQVVMWW